MSDATIVVESAKKGGAIITAGIANSYNRDVFAIPGRIYDKASEGCNHLIKTHQASIAQSADDIKYLLGWNEESKRKKRQQPKLIIELDENSRFILQLIQDQENISIDQLSIKSNKAISEVATILLNLEFEGLIECLPGKVYKCL